jgi:predicted DNA-binding protein with PD1-like motif
MSRKISLALLLAASLMESSGRAASDPTPAPHIFGPGHIQEIYRVALDADALLLESIMSVIKQKDIQDGEVVISAGSVKEASYHFVTTTEAKAKDEYKTVKGPFEILGGSGLIAAGKPHIHITFSAPDKGAFGGPLENGCRVLYLAEITFYKFAGTPLVRKNNANGIETLQLK